MTPKYVIFGAGITGMAAVNYFNKDQIIAVIDNYPGKIGTLFEGIPVISFSEYLNKYRDYQIIVSIYSKNYFDVKKQLEEGGVFDYFTAPPVLYGFKTPEKSAEILLLSGNHNRIIFYGINPVSLRMCSWLKRNCDVECCFIKTLKEKERSIYEDTCVIIDFNSLMKNDTVVITTNEAEEHIRRNTETLFSKTVFDIYKDSFFHHPELQTFNNKHKGQRCFVIGNGPSLKAEDLNKINSFGDISFASNKIYYIFKSTKWRPNYYVMIDRVGLGKDDESLKKIMGSACSLFLADYHYTNWKENKEVNYFSMVNKIYEDKKIDFSEDITKGIASGRTVTYAILQLACYMGFSEIYLLGVDFTWGENGSDTHFCKDYSDKGEENYQRTQAIKDKEEIHLSYLTAKKYAEQRSIKIFNATRGGNLEVFERVDFDKLFSRNTD